MASSSRRVLSMVCLLAASLSGGCADPCLALPTCPAGSAEVLECPAGLTCTEETLCGTTILCGPPAPDAG
ncbi:MAG: hypothetical protein AB8I08_15730 [Sandaracinaceae bacterium]